MRSFVIDHKKPQKKYTLSKKDMNTKKNKQNESQKDRNKYTKN